MRSEVQILSPRPERPSLTRDDAGSEGRVPAPRLRVSGQRERVVGRPQDVDPLEHGLRDRLAARRPRSSPTGPAATRGRRVPRRPSGCVTAGPPPPAASASSRAIVASSRPRSRSFANRSAARSRSRLIRARARTSPPSGSGRLAIATVLALSVDDTATCSKRPPDRVLVHLDLVRLAPDARVDRLAVALDPARGGGRERLAGVGVAVAPDVADEAAAAARRRRGARRARTGGG